MKKVRGRAASAVAGDLMLAPMVALMRLPLMATESRRGGSRETSRAISEKMAAATEGMMSAQLSAMQSALRFWPEVLSGRTPSLFSGAAVEHSLNAALRPASRLVKANFRRLSGG